MAMRMNTLGPMTGYWPGSAMDQVLNRIERSTSAGDLGWPAYDLITIDKDAKVYFSVSDANSSEKKDIIDAVNTAKNLGLTDAEKKNFSANPTAYIGVPFSQLKSYLDRTPEQLQKVVKPGIPAKDSTENEMIDWIKAAKNAFQGKRMNVLVKGDDASKYPSFQGFIIAMKKNDEMKFQVVTASIPVPMGSELYNTQQKAGTKAVE